MGQMAKKAHQLVMRYANGLRRLSRNLKHPRQNLIWQKLRLKASDLKLMTTIQPPTLNGDLIGTAGPVVVGSSRHDLINLTRHHDQVIIW